MSTRKKGIVMEKPDESVPAQKRARFHKIEDLIADSPRPRSSPRLNRASFVSSPKTSKSHSNADTSRSASRTRMRSICTPKSDTPKSKPSTPVVSLRVTVFSTPGSSKSASRSSRYCGRSTNDSATIRTLRSDDNKENIDPNQGKNYTGKGPKSRHNRLGSPSPQQINQIKESSSSTNSMRRSSRKNGFLPSVEVVTPQHVAVTRVLRSTPLTEVRTYGRSGANCGISNSPQNSAKKVVPKLVFRRSAVHRAAQKYIETSDGEQGEENITDTRTPIPKLRMRKSVLSKNRRQTTVAVLEFSPKSQVDDDNIDESASEDEEEVKAAPRVRVSRNKNAQSTSSSTSTPKPKTPLTKMKSDLKDDISVKSLLGREKEFTTIRDAIDGSIKSETPMSMYISGAPGTGKTATTRLVLKSFGNRIHAQIVNCMAMNTQTQLLAEIFSFHGVSGKPSVSALKELLNSLDRPMVCVLDEIDHLTSKNNSMLYSVFRWPQEVSKKVILIGIANSIDLTERLLPKLKLSIPPLSVVFAPYANETIKEILTDKMQKDQSEQMDARAIELCARKVAAVSGDLRSALHVMKQARSAALPGTPAGCREVLGALNNVYSSPLARAKLPLQGKLLLAVCLKLSTNNKKIPLTKQSLFKAYFKACDVVKVPSVSSDELDAVYDTLESLSFVCLQGNKIRLQVDATTAKTAIADKGMVESIFSVNL